MRACYEKPSPYSSIGKSDHLCVLWKPKRHRVAQHKRKTQITRPLLESGIRTFGTWIQSLDWHMVLKTNGTQHKADAFYTILDQGMSSCFPEKKKTVHTNDKPWITPQIKDLIAKRQKAFISGFDQEWRKLRNEVKRKIEKAKIDYHANRIRGLQKTESRKWYQQIKKVTNSGKSELRLDIPGVCVDDEKGKADAVNDMFAKVSAHVPPLDTSELPAYLPAKDPPPILHPWEVYSELMKINPNKSGGPDRIPGKIIKEFAYEMSIPLTDILNSSFAEGIVPSQWKQGIVVPIPKQRPPTLDKLRPISLTSIFAKVAEGFVSRWVIDDISHMLDIRQFGNVAGVSTNHYLVNMMHYLHTGAEVSHNTGTIVLTDFSKAFDLVDHSILIKKIIQMGVRRNIVPWLCDFLQQRQQCVRYNNILSDFVQLTAGVPQGTKLGPIGFQILINDAADESHAEVWKYVDDLTFAENSTSDSNSHIQEDLNKFSDWAATNGLNLNAKKCQALEVNFSKTKPQHADLSIGSDKLDYVDKAKILGISIQNDLKWQSQVDIMIKKANTRLFMLRSLKRFGFDQDELTVVYKSYVRPVLEYADVVWHSGLTCKQASDLERIQRRAIRTILGYKYISYSKSIQQCNIKKLSDRRVEHCRTFANGLSDSLRTSHLLPPTRISVHGRSLRSAHDRTQLRAKTNRFKQSPIPFYVTLLNTH